MDPASCLLDVSFIEVSWPFSPTGSVLEQGWESSRLFSGCIFWWANTMWALLMKAWEKKNWGIMLVVWCWHLWKNSISRSLLARCMAVCISLFCDKASNWSLKYLNEFEHPFIRKILPLYPRIYIKYKYPAIKEI